MNGVPEGAQRVVVEFNRELVSSKHSGREYGSWSRKWECSLSSVTRTDRDASGDDDAFLIGPGSMAHVLIVRYDDGDSYGSETGLIDVIHAFSDLRAAEAAKTLYEANKEFEGIVFEDDFGRCITMPLSTSHNSYFETIRSIGIVSMEITA